MANKLGLCKIDLIFLFFEIFRKPFFVCAHERFFPPLNLIPPLNQIIAREGAEEQEEGRCEGGWVCADTQKTVPARSAHAHRLFGHRILQRVYLEEP